MNRRAPRTLTPALDGLVATLAPATTLAHVQRVWELTTGPAIASAARPSAERDGVLTVTCEAAVWAQELHMMAADLVPVLNAAIGADAIRELRCRTA
jgi:predicted nucleic acid-binding Zn ribbon protein